VRSPTGDRLLDGFGDGSGDYTTTLWLRGVLGVGQLFQVGCRLPYRISLESMTLRPGCRAHAVPTAARRMPTNAAAAMMKGMVPPSRISPILRRRTLADGCWLPPNLGMNLGALPLGFSCENPSRFLALLLEHEYVLKDDNFALHALHFGHMTIRRVPSLSRACCTIKSRAAEICSRWPER